MRLLMMLFALRSGGSTTVLDDGSCESLDKRMSTTREPVAIERQVARPEMIEAPTRKGTPAEQDDGGAQRFARCPPPTFYPDSFVR